MVALAALDDLLAVELITDHSAGSPAQDHVCTLITGRAGCGVGKGDKFNGEYASVFPLDRAVPLLNNIQTEY